MSIKIGLLFITAMLTTACATDKYLFLRDDKIFYDESATNNVPPIEFIDSSIYSDIDFRTHKYAVSSPNGDKVAVIVDVNQEIPTQHKNVLYVLSVNQNNAVSNPVEIDSTSPISSVHNFYGNVRWSNNNILIYHKVDDVNSELVDKLVLKNLANDSLSRVLVGNFKSIREKRMYDSDAFNYVYIVAEGDEFKLYRAGIFTTGISELPTGVSTSIFGKKIVLPTLSPERDRIAIVTTRPGTSVIDEIRVYKYPSMDLVKVIPLKAPAIGRISEIDFLDSKRLLVTTGCCASQQVSERESTAFVVVIDAPNSGFSPIGKTQPAFLATRFND
jgi:hypothetical protein